MAGFGDPHLMTVEAVGLRLGIVGSRWHADLVDHMVERAQAAAKACGVDDVVVARVAGSVELPVVAQALAKRCDAVSMGLTRVSLDTQTPVAHGVLTVESLGQAKAAERTEGSSTVAALDRGVHFIGKKVVEEAAESWMAAEHEGEERTAEEISQLLYRVQVLMLARGLTLDDVYAHL